MSITFGPKIRMANLSLLIDKNNSVRSWKGKPITNFTRSSNNHDNHPDNKPFSTIAHSNSTNAVSTDVEPPFPGLDVYKLQDTGTDAQNLRYSFKFDVTNDSWMSYDEFYTWSTWIYLPSEFAGRWTNTTSIGCFQNSTGTDWHSATGYQSTYNYYGAGSVSTANIVPDMTLFDEWQRFGVTFKPLTSNIQLSQNSGNDNNKFVAGYLRPNISDAVNGGFPYHFYVAGGQLEESNFASPFVSDSRSSTEAFLDISGKTHTITATSVDYNTDGSFQFDGSSDKLTVTHSSDIQPTDAMSWMAWVYVDSSQTNLYPRIFDKGNILVHIGNSFPSTLAQNVNNSTGSLRQVAIGSTIPHSTWLHLAGSYDGRYGRLYKNGELIGTTDWTTNATINSTTQGMYIAGNGDNSRAFKGKIENFAFYSAAITGDDIKNAFEATRDIYSV